MSGAAGGTIVAWAAVHFRPLTDHAAGLVAAALARDAGRRGHDAGPGHAARSAALLGLCEAVPAAAARAAGRHHERPDGGGGPRGLAGTALTPGDRLVGWADAFVDALIRAAADGRTTVLPPADAWRDVWAAAAADTYRAARRGELCRDVAAAALDSLGVGPEGPARADAAGRPPKALALTDLGRTRLRLDGPHDPAAPHFLAATAGPAGPAATAGPGAAPAVTRAAA